MSLETLLEAAKYLEYRSEANARGEAAEDFLSFLNLGNNGSNLSCISPTISNSNSNNSTNNDSSRGIEEDIYGRADAESKERRRTGGAGTREVHNKLEKNRRAHLKKCFETLKRQLPNMDERKTSNLGILRSSLRYIQTLKRKEKEFEHETERLAREKITLQQTLALLRKDFTHLEHVDIDCLLPDADNVTNSTSTASECGPLTDDDEDLGNENLSTEALSPKEKGVAEAAPSSTRTAQHTVTTASGVAASDASSVFVAPVTVQSPSLTKWVPVQWSAQQQQLSGRPLAQHHTAVQMVSTVAVSGATPTASFATSRGQIVSSNAATLAFNNIPSRVQMAQFPFPTQVVPQANFLQNGNGGILTTHSAMQVLAQPTVRFIQAPVSTPLAVNVTSTMGARQSSGKITTLPPGATISTAGGGAAAVVPSSMQATSGVQLKALSSLPQLPPPLQVGAGSGSTLVKGLLTTGNAPGQIAIPVAQLTVKPANTMPTLTMSPSMAATTLNFQAAPSAMGAAGPSVSGPPASTIARHIMAGTVKPITQVRPSPAQLAQIAHVMAPTTLVSSVDTSGAHHMAPMSVMSSLGHAAMAQVLTPSQLGKVVTASPFLKSVGQIPIIQSQFVPHLGTVSAQQLVKPIVMVTSSNVLTTTNTVAAAAREPPLNQTPLPRTTH